MNDFWDFFKYVIYGAMDGASVLSLVNLLPSRRSKPFGIILLKIELLLVLLYFLIWPVWGLLRYFWFSISISLSLLFHFYTLILLLKTLLWFLVILFGFLAILNISSKSIRLFLSLMALASFLAIIFSLGSPKTLLADFSSSPDLLFDLFIFFSRWSVPFVPLSLFLLFQWSGEGTKTSS